MAIDGDTLQLLPAEDGCRVRLWGVDAPEMHEDEGPSSSRGLQSIASGHRLDCREEHGTSYDRIVARCLLPDGSDLADQLVRLGHATDWPEYSGGHYAPAEAEARRERRGMWGE